MTPVSIPPDPDDPTRRLPPAPPLPARRREVAYVEPDDLLWRQEVLDRLRSLTTAVVLLAVLAVSALGIALWALFADPADERGAAPVRVRELEERVDELESELEQTASGDALSTLREQQRSLDQRLQALDAQVRQPIEDLDVMSDAIVETQQAVEQLEQRIDALEQQP
jgi:peptidoglycan hydrolase CwlO-like protein